MRRNFKYSESSVAIRVKFRLKSCPAKSKEHKLQQKFSIIFNK